MTKVNKISLKITVQCYLSWVFRLQSIKQRTLRKRKFLHAAPIPPPSYASLPLLITNSGQDCVHNTHERNAHAHDKRGWRHPQHSAPTPERSWSRSGHAATTRALLNIPKVKQGRHELPDAHHPGQPWGSEHLNASHHLAHLAICGTEAAAPSSDVNRFSRDVILTFLRSRLVFLNAPISALFSRRRFIILMTPRSFFFHSAVILRAVSLTFSWISFVYKTTLSLFHWQSSLNSNLLSRI